TRSSGASMPGATDTTASGSTTTFFVGAWSESGGVSRGCGCTLLKPSFPDCEPAPRPKKPDILAVIWPKYDWPLLAVSALVLTTAVRSSIEKTTAVRALVLRSLLIPFLRNCVVDKPILGDVDDIFILLKIKNIRRADLLFIAFK